MTFGLTKKNETKSVLESIKIRSRMKTNKAVQVWWKQNENIFLLPPAYHSHTHKWEKLDIDTVGCCICGIVHICDARQNIVPCCLEVQDDSSVVCKLTGLVTKTSSFYDGTMSTRDYRITSVSMSGLVAAESRKTKSTQGESMEIVGREVKGIIELLLYSQNSQESRKKEGTRVSKKVQQSFSGKISQLVANRSTRGTLCVVDALAESIKTFSAFDRGNVSAVVPPQSDWDWLVAHICCVLTFISLPRQFAITPKNQNLKNLIVSFLYMTKNGLEVSGATFIPKIPLMQRILPLEVHMWSCFKLQAKSITEGENLLKRLINEMTPQQIEMFRDISATDNARKRKRCD